MHITKVLHCFFLFVVHVWTVQVHVMVQSCQLISNSVHGWRVRKPLGTFTLRYVGGRLPVWRCFWKGLQRRCVCWSRIQCIYKVFVFLELYKYADTDKMPLNINLFCSENWSFLFQYNLQLSLYVIYLKQLDIFIFQQIPLWTNINW